MAHERLEEIRQQRLAKRQTLLAQGGVPYPAEVRRTHTLAQVAKAHESLQAAGTVLTLVGRLRGLRRHGGVVFFDLQDATGTLQLQFSKDTVPPMIWAAIELFDIGDFIETSGKLILTQRGVLTLQSTEAHLVSKSIRPLPATWYGLKDHEARLRARELDLLLNEHSRATLDRRSDIIQWLRHQLTQAGFQEVETPILQPLAGGAAATPFTTQHHALGLSLFLRIAPELYLKRLLVGGYEKVFELGRNFRNEGIDREHNPEFTMLELYWAYADYEDLMDFAEELLGSLVRALTDGEEITYRNATLSFAAPLSRQRYVDVVSHAVGFDILHDKNPETYVELLNERGIEVPTVRTYAKLVDELYKKLVRPHILQPTLLYDYPVELAPLAKRNLTDPRIAEKFQLLAAGTELINAYTELNDPVEQRLRFEEQQAARAAGDHEAQAVDEEYLRALEYGMPPAAGWGLGIDRLVALLTDAPTVRDTIAFPLLKPEK